MKNTNRNYSNKFSKPAFKNDRPKSFGSKKDAPSRKPSDRRREFEKKIEENNAEPDQLILKGRHEVVQALESGQNLDAVFISSAVRGPVVSQIREFASASSVPVKEMSPDLFERKFGEAIKLMNVQSNLEGYETTQEFIEAFKKYMKIVKVCNKPEDCFSKKIKQADGNFLQTSELTTAEKLGRPQFNTNTVGLIFADGITAVLAYNPTVTPNDNGEVVTFSSSEYGKSSRSVKVSTNAISMVYDVNGYTKPNTNGKDILGINSNIGGKGTDCEQKGDLCVTDLGTNYKAIPCLANTGVNPEWCGTPSEYTNDYWAGAKKACADIGMRLPSQQELKQIYTLGTVDDSNSANKYWTSEAMGFYQGAFMVDFADGVKKNAWKYDKFNVICASANKKFFQPNFYQILFFSVSFMTLSPPACSH